MMTASSEIGCTTAPFERMPEYDEKKQTSVKIVE